MTDWIDEEAQRRAGGLTRPLTQAEHAAVNARYPGCTAELCIDCGAHTGNAGRGDGSLYDEDGNGPFCRLCYSLYREESQP